MERPDVSQWLQLLGSTEQAVGAMKENPPNPVRYFIDYGKEHVGQIAALWFLFQQE